MSKNSPDSSTAVKVKADDLVGRADKIRDAQGHIAAHRPEDVLCMMACVVTNEGRVTIHAMGADDHLVKMLGNLAETVQQGIAMDDKTA